MAEEKRDDFTEGGNEEVAGIVITLFVNLISYALHAYESFPNNSEFNFNIAMQVLLFIVPIVTLFLLIQNLKKKGLVYFSGFFYYWIDFCSCDCS